MPSSQDRENAKPASVDSILAEFDGRRETLEALCQKTKSVIEECLADAKIRYQSVQARVKNRDKLRDKYSNPEKNYKQLDEITDLAGLRIVTYYEDEVDSVAEVITREFEIDPKNSTDKRNSEPDRFSYHAVNYVCCHSPGRSKIVEYKRFSGLRFEIQITSILSHAWAEIEHGWYDLRDDYPPEIKKRFARMLALLEVAESEFRELRDKKTAYRRSVAVQVEANVSGVPLDRVSLRSFVEQDTLVASIDKAIAIARDAVSVGAPNDLTIETASKWAGLVGLKTIEDLRSSLKQYEGVIPEFVLRCRPYLILTTKVIPAGACVNHLGLMLIGSKGESNLSAAMSSLGWILPQAGDLSRVAQEVLAKYPG